MSAAIVRKIDDLGRIVIPAETRRMFDIHEGDELAISVEDGAIMIRAVASTCVFCGTSDDVADFRGRGVCRSCRTAIAGD